MGSPNATMPDCVECAGVVRTLAKHVRRGKPKACIDRTFCGAPLLLSAGPRATGRHDIGRRAKPYPQKLWISLWIASGSHGVTV